MIEYYITKIIAKIAKNSKTDFRRNCIERYINIENENKIQIYN